MWLIAQQPNMGLMTRPLPPGVAFLLMGAALALGYGLYRLSRVETFSRLRPYIMLSILSLCGLVIVEFVFVVASTLTTSWLALGLFLLGLLGAVNYQWMRNVVAGLAVAFEDRVNTGDSISIVGQEGTVQEFGLRAIRIRSADGTYHDIPNHTFIDQPISNLARGDNSACEITLRLPGHVDVESARRRARRAAITTPLASPRQDPEIYVDAEDGSGRPILRVRGYVFDANHRESFRSDVTTRLLDAFDDPVEEPTEI